MALFGRRRRSAKQEDAFHPYINHQSLVQRSSASSSSDLRGEIERYKTEIQTLRSEFHGIHSNQVSMIESLQQENKKLCALNQQQSKTMKRMYKKLSVYQTACKHKDDEITRLTHKLDAGLQHVTSEYLINEQRKEIRKLTAKLEQYERFVRERMEQRRVCDERNGVMVDEEDKYSNESAIDYYLDSVCFMMNWVQSKYNG